MNNQTENATLKYEKEQRLCLGVVKIESKSGTIIVFDYSGGKIVTIDVYKK